MNAGELRRAGGSANSAQTELNAQAIDELKKVIPDPSGSGLDSGTVENALHELSTEIKDLNAGDDFAGLYNTLRNE